MAITINSFYSFRRSENVRSYKRYLSVGVNMYTSALTPLNCLLRFWALMCQIAQSSCSVKQSPHPYRNGLSFLAYLHYRNHNNVENYYAREKAWGQEVGKRRSGFYTKAEMQQQFWVGSYSTFYTKEVNMKNCIYNFSYKDSNWILVSDNTILYVLKKTFLPVQK